VKQFLTDPSAIPFLKLSSNLAGKLLDSRIRFAALQTCFRRPPLGERSGMADLLRQMTSRRLVLWLLAAGGTLLALPGNLAFALFRGRRREQPITRDNPFVAGGKALVGVAGGGSAEAMVAAAVELIGGFGRLAVEGKRVLVKPNVVSGSPSPTTTSPEVVGAVVRLLYRAGAREVVVGDMSALLRRFTLRNMGKNGIRRAAEEAGAKVVAFEEADWVEVEIPGARYVNRVLVTDWLYRADLIVNLPVIKTHRSASYSICLKNFIGCTHLSQRPYLVDADHWEELVADFNLACRPDLNIVDGTVSMIEGGPWEGTQAKTGLVIASGDRVAADVVGLGVIRSFGRWAPVTSKDVWQQRQIRHALALGLGRGKEEIELRAGSGDGRFRELMDKVRSATGL
jgi:uncharacterized protein (DUF362 family)